jgi:hypothetical protein
MKTKLLLLLILISFVGWLQAQDTIRSLIISEARFDEALDAYVELTNMGDSALHLKNFEFGVVHPWDARIDPTDINKWFNVGADSWFMLPDTTLDPGKSIVIANIYDFNPKMWQVVPNHWAQSITKPEIWRLADIQIKQPEVPVQPTFGDSVSTYSDIGEVWQGRECWYVRYHNTFWSNDPIPILIKDSIVTDQVGGIFIDPDGQQAWGGKNVAGVLGATENSILIRKFSVKHGNIDFENSRGTNASESEWTVIPIEVTDRFEATRDLFWTVGNHVNASLEPETLISDAVSINWIDSTLIVPWGIRRDDSVMHKFSRKPGIAWHFDYSASHVDSAYMSVRTGDVLTVYACGDVASVIPFRLIVSDPTTDASIVIPKRTENSHHSFLGQGAFCEVTDKVPGMDTIRSNILYGISHATSTDTLFKYLEKAPNASWTIIFVDGAATRTYLKNGDILQVTAEDGNVKEYFIKVSGPKGGNNAELSSITWPDIPGDYRGSYGWAGDTIPGFMSSKFNYKVIVPYDIPGIPALAATNSDINATLIVNRAKNLTGTTADRTVTFTSTAPDGDKVLTYTVELVKGKDPSNVQPWKGEPFISQYCFRQDYSNDFLEIVNPGTEPLDLSHYMLTFSGVYNPADAITGNADASSAAWANRYVKYIPGMRWQDSTAWKLKPAIAVPDMSGINPVVLSGDMFVIADKRSVGGTAADYLIPRIDLDFAHNPWNETISQGNAMDQWWAIVNKTILFKILNDSVYNGLKPATDPKDFQVIDMVGYNSPSSTKWIIGGTIADPVSDWTRKPYIYKGNPNISTGVYPGGSFGMDESDSEWTMLKESLLTMPPYNYNWPATRIQLADGIGSHFMDEVTVYKSTVSSVVYSVTPGYKTESLRGVLPGTSVADFKNNILKADTGQRLKLLSHIDGSILNDTIKLVSDDTLLVISADHMNRTKYVLWLTPGGLSKNDTLISSIYTIVINDTVGSISGFPCGTLLRDVLNGVEMPANCTFNVINGSNGYQPLKTMNWDTLYVNVHVSDNICLEVIAENGVNKIVYQLKPTSSPDDAFVTSDFYTVDQTFSLIYQILDNTTVYSLFKYLTPSPGATMMLVNKYGFPRDQGFIAIDDKLVVTSQDGTNSKTYYFQQFNCCDCCTNILYAVSDEYFVDQIDRLIYNDFTLTTWVSDFLATLSAPPYATIKVVDKQGNENTDTLAIGDRVKVNVDDHECEVYYNIVTMYNCSVFYSVYVVSDVYAIDQSDFTIDVNFMLSDGVLVSDFMAHLFPSPSASIKVVDAQGIENTGVLAIGDRVVVTSANSIAKAEYSIISIIDAVNAIKNNSISIYPNPTSGNFTISSIPAGSKIAIRNILGQYILETFVTDDNLQRSLEGQPAGIYFILISNDTSSSCYKLIVK